MSLGYLGGSRLAFWYPARNDKLNFLVQVAGFFLSMVWARARWFTA